MDSQFVTCHLYKSVVYRTCLWGNIFNISDMIIISIEIICYILLSSLIRAHDASFNRADFISFTIETSAMNVSPTTSPGIRNFPTHFFSARKKHLNGKYTLFTDYCVNRTHGILTFIRGIIHRRSFYGKR